MHFHIQEWINQFGYFGIFFILFFEMVGIPFPAETTLTLSGIEWVKGDFTLPLLLTAAVLGNVVGSTVAYGIGRYLGRPVIIRFGRYVGITAEKLDIAEAKFKKYRISVVVIGKFIAGIRILIPYLAGLNRMSFIVFSIYNLISTIAWAVTFIVLGRYIGVLWGHYHLFFRQYLLPIIILAVLLLTAYIMVKRKIKKSKRESREPS